MAATRPSEVWGHFKFLSKDGKEDKTTTVCLLCCVEFKYTTGSTSSMTAHLKRKHSINLKDSESQKSKSTLMTAEKKVCNYTKQSTSSGQLDLKDIFLKKNKLSASSTRHKSITKSIGIFLAKDMRPYSVVENEGFRAMVYELEPRYDIPSRRHFAEKVIPNLYDETRANVELKLRQAPFISLTTDSWTSRATESYNTVTAHFLSDDWEVGSCVLQTRVMDVSHTSENLSEMLLTCIAEWNLKRGDQMPSITTDNAANIINAGRLAGFYPHIRCVAHTLNLATQRGLQVQLMERLLGRIRRVVTFFHKSTTAMAILRNKQMILELPQHKLIQDVSTRWNSTYDMVSRFIEQNTAIEATLQSKDVKKNAKDVYTLSEDDITNAASVLGILEPMKTVTTLLCSEKSPTTSLIHPLKEMLLRQLKVKDDDSSLIKSVKAAITSNLEPRYTEPETLKFLLESSFLDPRFKTMPYICDNEKRDIFLSLSSKVKGVKVKMEKEEERVEYPPLPTLLKDNIATSTDVRFPNSTSKKRNSTSFSVDLPADMSNDLIQEQPSIKKRKSAMLDLFGEVFVTKVEPAKSLEIRFEQELTGYKSEDSIPLESDPLDWWKRNQTSYPLLSNLAKHYLCVPATSVASERVFSTADDLVTAQRSCLSGEQVDKLIFLKKNYKYP